MTARDRLILALDLPSLADAKALVQRLRPITPWFKIGSVLFTSVGPDAVRMVHEAGGQVFLDLKFHDIPQTIAGGVAASDRRPRGSLERGDETAQAERGGARCDAAQESTAVSREAAEVEHAASSC